MGICPCAGKKSDTTAEIISESKDLRQKIEAAPELVTIHSNAAIKESSEVKPQLIEELKESIHSDHGYLTKVQALFRGYACRLEHLPKLFNINLPLNHSQDIPEPEIPETDTQAPFTDFRVDLSQLPEGFPSKSASDLCKTLGRFDFGEPLGKEFKSLHKLEDGSYYQGEVDDLGNPCGKGSIFYTDGSLYEGGLELGKFSGYGRMITGDGDVFVGEFSDGQLTGLGRKVYANGNMYEGELLNSMPDGFGKETMPDGSNYEGNFRNGLKSGNGHYVWPDGSSYKGGFVDDKIEGFGLYTWPDKVYEGEWKDNIQHGNGVFRWNDGKKYSGGYVMGKKQGFGVFEWPDGKKYEGQWVDGKQEGEGEFSKNGKVKQKGIWKDGKFASKAEEGT